MDQPAHSTAMALDDPEIIELSQDADITLVIKTEEGETTDRFYASTAILKQCSQYFRVMFSERFMEGAKLRSGTERPEIVVHEENPWGLGCVLYALHHKTGSLPRKVQPQDLAQVAVCCDKYGCVEAMGIWADQWCEVKEWWLMDEWGYALLAAWVLKPTQFRKMVQLAALNIHPEEFRATWKSIGVEDRLPRQLMGHLKDENERFRNKINALFEKFEVSLRSDDRAICKGRTNMRCPKCKKTFHRWAKKPCCDGEKLEIVYCTSDYRATQFRQAISRGRVWKGWRIALPIVIAPPMG